MIEGYEINVTNMIPNTVVISDMAFKYNKNELL